MFQTANNTILVLEKSTIYWGKNLPKLPIAGMERGRRVEGVSDLSIPHQIATNWLRALRLLLLF